MARASPACVPAPAAHRYRAADGTASYGSITSGGPGSPNALIPHTRQVDGRNCIGPSAPALEGPVFAPNPLSIWPMAASTVQDMPGQERAADSRDGSM